MLIKCLFNSFIHVLFVFDNRLMLVRYLQNDENKVNFQKLIDTIKESKQGKTLGVFSKENFPGEFIDAWRAALKQESFDTVS